jgi:hypothetical protein
MACVLNLNFTKMKIRQIYKGELFSRTHVKNNIKKAFLNASKERQFDWYGSALEFAKEIAGKYLSDSELDLNKAAGIIAALSPLKYWDQNKDCAESFLKFGISKHMKRFENKAKSILHSSGTESEILTILNGRKIISFYLNIRHPDSCTNVTIDRHALSVAVGNWVTDEYYSGMTAIQYQWFADCYILAAKELNVAPLYVQSVTWEYFRSVKREYKRTA